MTIYLLIALGFFVFNLGYYLHFMKKEGSPPHGIFQSLFVGLSYALISIAFPIQIIATFITFRKELKKGK